MLAQLLQLQEGSLDTSHMDGKMHKLADGVQSRATAGFVGKLRARQS